MQSLDGLSRNVLLLLVVVFAGINWWVAALRSTIPRSLVGTVVDKTRLIEKKAGVDDVYLVTFSTGEQWQVDQSVFEALYQDARITKLAWSCELSVDEQFLRLEYSPDARGMLICMPLLLAICVIVGRWRPRSRIGSRTVCDLQ